MKIEFKDIASKYTEYLDELYSYAVNMGFSEQEIMDAVHDVFYKLCINHSSLNEITNLKTYLFRSLRNRLIDKYRIDRDHFDFKSESGEEHNSPPFQITVSVEDEMIDKEDTEEIKCKVENVLQHLTHRQREIVYLRFIREYSYEEIADIMNITVESSRNLLSKSITKLKNSPLHLTLIISLLT